jgi:hypothetical protein
VSAVAGSPLISDVSMRPLSYENVGPGGTRAWLEFTLVARIREAVDPAAAAERTDAAPAGEVPS